MKKNALRTASCFLAVLVTAAAVRSAAADKATGITSSNLPFTVTQPGVYALAGDLMLSNPAMHGITVATNDVTIDLRGHTLRGPGADSGHGILQAKGCRALVVSNGTIAAWGGGSGVYAPGLENRIENIVVVACSSGIHAGMAAVIEGCTVSGGVQGVRTGPNCRISATTAFDGTAEGIEAGAWCRLVNCASYHNGSGIRAGDHASIELCTAYGNRGNGIEAARDAEVVSCSAYENETGIRAAEAGARLINCSARENRQDGIAASDGVAVSNCSATANGRAGIVLRSSCRAVGNSCHGNGGPGILAAGTGNHVEDNTVVENDCGIRVEGTGNTVIGNRASRNAAGNFSIPKGNTAGPVCPETDPGYAKGESNLEF